MNIANYLTFTRLLISPLFLLIYLEHDTLGISNTLLPCVLLILLTFSAISDILDGHLARKFSQVTNLGKLLDPMTDSLVHISVFLTFTLDPVRLPLPVVFIFLYRDSIISTLRTICALKGLSLAARISGKIKTIAQAVAAFAILGLMIPHSLGYLSTEMLHTYSTIIASLAAAYTIFSGTEYIYANWTYIKAATHS